MKVEVEELSPVEKRVEVELPVEMVGDEIEEQYQELQGKAQVKGFRPGKVPRKILERLFKDYVYEAATEKLVKQSMEAALARKGVEPVVPPVVDAGKITPGEPFKYTLHVEVKPGFEVSDYVGLKVKHREEVVSEEDVDRVLAGLQEEAALLKDPEPARPIREDDQVLAELELIDEATQQPLPVAKEQTISLWKETWIPGLKERLSGRQVGEEVSFSVTIGAEEEQAPREYRGKTLRFSFKITGVKERELPPLDDQLAKNYSRFETLAELRDSIREGLSRRLAAMNRDALEEKLVQALVEKNPIPVPPTLVKREAVALAQDFLGRSLRHKPQPEEAERFAELFMKEAKTNLQASYLLEAISKKEGIEASEEEIEEEIKQRAEAMGLHPDKLKARLKDTQREAIKFTLIMRKTLDFLREKANIEPEEGEEKKLDNGEAGKETP